jgi:hypothetical protein
VAVNSIYASIMPSYKYNLVLKWFSYGTQVMGVHTRIMFRFKNKIKHWKIKLKTEWPNLILKSAQTIMYASTVDFFVQKKRKEIYFKY